MNLQKQGNCISGVSCLLICLKINLLMTPRDDDYLPEGKDTENFENKMHEETEEEPRKNFPRIKARINVDVYHCKCGTPNCALSPSW